MKNRHGKALKDRLNEDIEYAQTICNTDQQQVLAVKVLGAVDMAVEFGLITYKEWEQYISRIFKML